MYDSAWYKKVQGSLVRMLDVIRGVLFSRAGKYVKTWLGVYTAMRYWRMSMGHIRSQWQIGQVLEVHLGYGVGGGLRQLIKGGRGYG